MKSIESKIHVVETPEDYINLLDNLIKEKKAEEAAKSEMRKWLEALARPFVIAFYLLFGVFMIIFLSILSIFEKKAPPVDPVIEQLYEMDCRN